MLGSSIPARFPIPWGNSAGGPYIRAIPKDSQIGILAGAASLTDGFPPLNFSPVGAGGVPPFGEDFNGILNQVTAWAQWVGAGGPVPWDSTFSTAIGGYPKGAMLAAATAGYYWLSTADSNTTNPDAGGANWVSVSLLGGTFTTGDTKTRPTAETLPGWVRGNGNTIGNAASGATELADASAAALFAWHWNNFSNSQCPVSGGRGASAAADFAANKTIVVLDFRGLSGIWGGDTMGATAGPAGRYAGVPFTTGNATTPGSVFGANSVTLSLAQIPTFTPSGSIVSIDSGHFHQLSTQGGPGGTPGFNFSVGSPPGTQNTTTNSANITSTFTGTPVGGGGAHSNAPLGMIGTIYLKL